VLKTFSQELNPVSNAARFDIRIPIGGLFVLLGGILVAYGLVTRSDLQLYARSENIVINLWWGLIMAVFGAGMFFFGTRAKEKPAS
jgi:hypothetical protein